MIDVTRLRSFVAEGLEAIRAEVMDAEIFAAWNRRRIMSPLLHIVGDSSLSEDGKRGQPLKPNTVRIDDNFIPLFQQVIGVSRDKRPTLV